MSRQPVLFLSHGAPPLLEDPDWAAQLRTLSSGLPQAKALLVVSAHWEAEPVAIGATRTLPLIYDFYGFPERFYSLRWASPGAPWLAARVRELLGAAGQATVDQPGRGWDHGTWVPLLQMYPEADLPTLQISIPNLRPQALYALGQALAPLRDEGVLLMGSGSFTHNLRALGVSAPWAKEFEDWAQDVLTRRDDDALIDFERKAPAARIAHPRTEHFVPLLFAAGASQGEPARAVVSGMRLGSLSIRSVQMG